MNDLEKFLKLMLKLCTCMEWSCVLKGILNQGVLVHWFGYRVEQLCYLTMKKLRDINNEAMSYKHLTGYFGNECEAISRI